MMKRIQRTRWKDNRVWAVKREEGGMKMVNWKGEYHCPVCKSEMDKFSDISMDNPRTIEVCWKCKMVFRIQELTLCDMRD